MEKEIKKIAILYCQKSSRVCTGAACFRTFYDRKKSFEQYAGQDVELSAYFHCNGCEADKETDAGFIEKCDRMVQEQVDKVHIGICALSRCDQPEKMIKALEDRGIIVEKGTH